MSEAPALRAVLGLTGRMLQHARDGDWDEVLRIEAQRRGPFVQFAAALQASQPAAAAAPQLRQLLEAEAEIRALAAQRRHDLAGALDSVGMQRRLADEYGAF